MEEGGMEEDGICKGKEVGLGKDDVGELKDKDG